MRVPPPPPNVDDVLTQLFEAGAPMLARQMMNMELPDDEYLPWRELRRHEPVPMIQVDPLKPGPASEHRLTHEQWWAVLRNSRRHRARSIPSLVMTDGLPFSFVVTDRILRDCDRMASTLKGEIGVGGEVVNSATRDRYVIHSLEDEAITSSQLEGAMTTRRVAKQMLREARPPKTHGEKMILNNYNAMRHVAEIRDRKLTPALVCEIHRIVTEGTLDNPDDAGRLQANDDNRVGVYATDDDVLLHQPPPAEQLPERLEALCDFANGEDDGPYVPGVLRALTVHFMMGYNHFFVDGNGRTARSLFYWTMLHEGYWLAEYVAISSILNKARVAYGQSFLDVESDAGDLTYFFHYHLGVLNRAVTDLEHYVKQVTRELSAARRRLDPATGEFNHRQITLLDAAFQRRDLTWTAQSVARQFGVTIVTAHNDLDDLTARGWLARERQGRRYVWHATTQIDELML